MNTVKKIEIVSLSRGLLGEPFVRHEKELGLRRLKDRGIEVVFAKHALDGIDALSAHPEDRAADLLCALEDETVDMILCAIGGDDTYRLLPYLFDHGELALAVKKSPSRKIFLGFSDTTTNHLMLHKVGLPTFYGQSFLSDLCELAPEMLPYTQSYFDQLIRTGGIAEVRPSGVWYEERTCFDESALGTDRVSHPDGGFEVLQGAPVFEGEILGGCIDTLYDLFDNTRYADSVSLTSAYHLFPTKKDWEGKILLLESSEEKMPPAKYKDALLKLKETGLFDVLHGVLIGKPIDRVYEEDYKAILKEVLPPSLPVVCNLNIGHASPRCILPFGVKAVVDAKEQVIRFPAFVE